MPSLPAPKGCRRKIPNYVNQLTDHFVPRAYRFRMARKNQLPTSFDVQGDLKTDYALIATGIGAALIALAYLLLT